MVAARANCVPESTNEPVDLTATDTEKSGSVSRLKNGSGMPLTGSVVDYTPSDFMSTFEDRLEKRERIIEDIHISKKVKYEAEKKRLETRNPLKV